MVQKSLVKHDFPAYSPNNINHVIFLFETVILLVILIAHANILKKVREIIINTESVRFLHIMTKKFLHFDFLSTLLAYLQHIRAREPRKFP